MPSERWIFASDELTWGSSAACRGIRPTDQLVRVDSASAEITATI
jgi:hypothetical protein